jgi:predicted  nucleic acid-binding Zn ribbon protein
MDDESDELVPQKQSLFPMTADDIVDNALQNLDEKQAREVTKKAADDRKNRGRKAQSRIP